MKIIRIISKIIIGIVLLIATLLVLQYVITPKYKFQEPQPFSGDNLYNPYAGADSSKWVKANFHVHTRSYAGVTNGSNNSNAFLDSIYRYFGYGIIGISDYQKINKYESNHKWFIPVYEHGFSYYKTHHLTLNAQRVLWFDLPFYETLHNKQFMVNLIKKDPGVVLTIPHPNLRQAYTFDDFKHLGNYNCLEICNNDRQFTFFYDTILSAGHPVFLMADDDAHNLLKIRDGIHCFNLINTEPVKDSILHAIKTGRLVGVNFNVRPFTNNEEKKIALDALPKISDISLKGDTLSVAFSDTVKTIKFIGQHGSVMKETDNSSKASYHFTKEDSYIRTEVLCRDSTIYYFNPVIRYNGRQLGNDPPEFDALRTWLLRSVVIIILILSFILYRKFRK
jgi:hypothetical protein